MDKKTTSSNDWKSMLAQVESKLELYLVDKAPSIPKEWKELMVKVAPWLTLIMAVISLPAILAVFGLSALMSPFAYLGGVRYGAGFTLTWVFTLAVLVLNVLAIPGLFKRAKSAWYLLFYGALLSALESLITFNLGGLIIGSLLGMYILFQVKEFYK